MKKTLILFFGLLFMIASSAQAQPRSTVTMGHLLKQKIASQQFSASQLPIVNANFNDSLSWVGKILMAGTQSGILLMAGTTSPPGSSAKSGNITVATFGSSLVSSWIKSYPYISENVFVFEKITYKVKSSPVV